MQVNVGKGRSELGYSCRYSPPAAALAQSTHVPQLYSCCCHQDWPKSRAQPAADSWLAAQSHQSSVWATVWVVVGAELREAKAFCWVDTIAPW